jgi:hypothetical protein
MRALAAVFLQVERDVVLPSVFPKALYELFSLHLISPFRIFPASHENVRDAREIMRKRAIFRRGGTA